VQQVRQVHLDLLAVLAVRAELVQQDLRGLPVRVDLKVYREKQAQVALKEKLDLKEIEDMTELVLNGLENMITKENIQ
jgi:hypothetical protein